MRYLVTILLLSAAFARSAILMWDPNTEPDVTGYRVYEGLDVRSYAFMVDVGPATSWTVTNAAPGASNHYAVTAYASNWFGLVESDFSDDVAWLAPMLMPPLRIQLSNAAPVILTIQSSPTLSNWKTVATVPISPTNTTNFYKVEPAVIAPTASRPARPKTGKLK